MQSKEVLDWNKKNAKRMNNIHTKHRYTMGPIQGNYQNKYRQVTNRITRWKVGVRWKAENTMKPTDVRKLFKDNPKLLDNFEERIHYWGTDFSHVKQLTYAEKTIKLLRS